jgi:uncharacterized protein (DUF2141 family)
MILIIQILLLLRYKKIEKMKKKLLILIFVISFADFGLNAGQIKINVLNIGVKEGFIHFGLYNDADLFPEDQGRVVGGLLEVPKVIEDGLIIENLDESMYAVAIYHDENSNNRFDTFLAIPQERYGFSNNAKVFFGPPAFEDASFFVGKDESVQIMIELR